MDIQLDRIVNRPTANTPAKDSPTIRGAEPKELFTGALENADSVSLSDFSLHLNRAAQSLTTIPAVDHGHVAAVINAVSSGYYRIDSTRTAENLLAMELRLPA